MVYNLHYLVGQPGLTGGSTMEPTYRVRISTNDMVARDHPTTPANRVEAILQMHIRRWLHSPHSLLRLEVGGTVITVEPRAEQLGAVVAPAQATVSPPGPLAGASTASDEADLLFGG